MLVLRHRLRYLDRTMSARMRFCLTVSLMVRRRSLTPLRNRRFWMKCLRFQKVLNRTYLAGLALAAFRTLPKRLNSRNLRVLKLALLSPEFPGMQICTLYRILVIQHSMILRKVLSFQVRKQRCDELHHSFLVGRKM